MKAWLKGGLIGAILGLLLWLSSSIIWNNSILRGLFIPFCGFSSSGESAGFCAIIIGHISNIILFGIIGAIIGLIVGRIKSSKK